jgi:hypothetical protein
MVVVMSSLRERDLHRPLLAARRHQAIHVDLRSVVRAVHPNWVPCASSLWWAY